MDKDPFVSLLVATRNQLSILENHVTVADTEPVADTIICDGSALVNTLPPRTAQTFEDYALLDVLRTILAYSSNYDRRDIVFDVYRQSSLKAETRAKRGSGVRRRVSGNGRLPPNWQNFVRDNDNKTELFIFLADKIAQMSARNKVIVTKEDDAVSTQTINMEELVPCSHDEADTQIYVHVIHAVRHGSKAMMIKASDTDVLIIAVSVLPSLQQSGLQQLRVSFGQRNNLCTNSVSPLRILKCLISSPNSARLHLESINST